MGTSPFDQTIVQGLAGACDGRVLTQFFGAADQIQAFLGLENQLNAQLTAIGPIGPENTVLSGFDLDTAGNLWGLGTQAVGNR